MFLGGCGKDAGSTGTRGVSADAATSRPDGVPDWIPIYSGLTATKPDRRQAGPVETIIQFQIEIPDDCVKVYNRYDEKFKLAGFNTIGEAGCCYYRVAGARNLVGTAEKEMS